MIKSVRLAFAFACVLGISRAASGQGLILPGAGPTNLSMAGASTATAIDVGGSYWNPAIISGLERSEFLISSQFAMPSIHLQSQLRAGSVNGVFPPNNRFGTSRSDSGVGAIPVAMVAFRLDDNSPWTFGLGTQYLVGGSVNFPGSVRVPITTPHSPPKFYGIGPIYGNATVGLSSLIASRQVNEKLAVAAGPLIAIESVTLNPATFAKPVNSYLKGSYPTFPAAVGSRPFWGAGFQLGLYYEVNENWNLGFSYKSPIWQERWGYNSTTATGSPNRIGVQADLPQILSWGVAYKGIEKTLIDVDLRYFDYANTALFGDAPPPGGLGLGWKNVFSAAIGGQYQATDQLTLRMGYLFNTNPIPAPQTLLNLQLPAITQHTLTFGAGYKLTPDIALNLAYLHSFRASNSGTIFELPGSVVREDVQLDSIVGGLTIQFGGKKRSALRDVGSLPTLPATASR